VIRVDNSDGVKYKLADGSWLLLRPSGTEPVLRIYSEATRPDLVDQLLDAGERMSGIPGTSP
jgi:phosphomannomutase